MEAGEASSTRRRYNQHLLSTRGGGVQTVDLALMFQLGLGEEDERKQSISEAYVHRVIVVCS